MMMVVLMNRKLKRILIFKWKELKSACEQMKADKRIPAYTLTSLIMTFTLG
jgi:hypothetical protein